MRIKQLLLWLIFICYIAFSNLGCAPSAENATSVYNDQNNYILWGLWTGISAPFSLIGQYILGMSISAFDVGKKSSLSYWVGYLFAIYLYARTIQFLWLALKEY